MSSKGSTDDSKSSQWLTLRGAESTVEGTGDVIVIVVAVTDADAVTDAVDDTDASQSEVTETSVQSFFASGISM